MKAVRTPQALAMKRAKAVSALDIRKCEAMLKGTSEEKLFAECTRMYENVSVASELIKKAYAAQATGTRVDRDQR